MDNHGNKFWSGSKLFPHTLDLNPRENSQHLNFIFFAAGLHAQSLCIPFNLTQDSICDIVEAMEVEPFVFTGGNKDNRDREVIEKKKSELPPREMIAS